MFGTKENMINVLDAIRVNYYCHAELDDIPKTVREIKLCNLTIDKIIYDDANRMWRINYFENKSK